VNLLRLPSELEIRLLAMARPRTIGGRTALAGAACAVAAVSIAFTAPVPAATRPTIRNLVQATRARMSSGQRALVRVGTTVLQLDSATVSPDGKRVSGRLSHLRIAALPPGALDTIPSAVAEDSIQRLARQLADQARRLDSVRARADSLTAEVRAARAARDVRLVGGMAQVGRGGRQPISQLMQYDQLPGETVNAAKMEREFVRSGMHVDAALADYFPTLAADASERTMVWFVADSSGKVLHASRSDDRPFRISPELTIERFPSVDSRDIEFMSIRNWTVGTRVVRVAWVGLKR
jgi:hypothetical protein